MCLIKLSTNVLLHISPFVIIITQTLPLFNGHIRYKAIVAVLIYMELMKKEVIISKTQAKNAPLTNILSRTLCV